MSESSFAIPMPNFDAEIAEIAYFKAQRRNFEAGHELDDWLEAEREFLEGRAGARHIF